MINAKKIKETYRPFSNVQEANRIIKGRRIAKRPGVFNDDTGEIYNILRTDDNGVYFEDFQNGTMLYYYDNLLLDYLFEDGEPIGIKKDGDK